MKPLPKTLQIYVDFIARAGRPVDFMEIFAQTPGVNNFRMLHERKLIRNTVEAYKQGEAFTGPKFPLYVLTEEGSKYVTPKPQRIQLSRRKGFWKPKDAVSVARPSVFGNPFHVRDDGVGWSQSEAVALYRKWLDGEDVVPDEPRSFKLSKDYIRQRLRGRTLACWCAIGTPCHADVLIEIANS